MRLRDLDETTRGETPVLGEVLSGITSIFSRDKNKKKARKQSENDPYVGDPRLNTAEDMVWSVVYPEIRAVTRAKRSPGYRVGVAYNRASGVPNVVFQMWPDSETQREIEQIADDEDPRPLGEDLSAKIRKWLTEQNLPASSFDPRDVKHPGARARWEDLVATIDEIHGEADEIADKMRWDPAVSGYDGTRNSFFFALTVDPGTLAAVRKLELDKLNKWTIPKKLPVETGEEKAPERPTTIAGVAALLAASVAEKSGEAALGEAVEALVASLSRPSYSVVETDAVRERVARMAVPGTKKKELLKQLAPELYRRSKTVVNGDDVVKSLGLYAEERDVELLVALVGKNKRTDVPGKTPAPTQGTKTTSAAKTTVSSPASTAAATEEPRKTEEDDQEAKDEARYASEVARLNPEQFEARIKRVAESVAKTIEKQWMSKLVESLLTNVGARVRPGSVPQSSKQELVELVKEGLVGQHVSARERALIEEISEKLRRQGSRSHEIVLAVTALGGTPVSDLVVFTTAIRRAAR